MKHQQKVVIGMPSQKDHPDQGPFFHIERGDPLLHRFMYPVIVRFPVDDADANRGSLTISNEMRYPPFILHDTGLQQRMFGLHLFKPAAEILKGRGSADPDREYGMKR